MTAHRAFAGDKEKAQQMCEQAAAYLKANGEQKIAEAINEKGMFKEGDIYAWVLKTDFAGKTIAIAHPSKAMVNKSFVAILDANGKRFVTEITDMAKKQDKGWTEYMWSDPITKKIRPKHTHFIRVGNLIVLCGYYK